MAKSKKKVRSTGHVINLNIKTDPLTAKVLLQEQLKNRTLTAYYETSLLDLEKQLTLNQERDFAYHQSMVRLPYEFSFHLDSVKLKNVDFLSRFEKLHINLGLSYLIAKLHYTCHARMVVLTFVFLSQTLW